MPEIIALFPRLGSREHDLSPPEEKKAYHMHEITSFEDDLRIGPLSNFGETNMWCPVDFPMGNLPPVAGWVAFRPGSKFRDDPGPDSPGFSFEVLPTPIPHGSLWGKLM